MSQIPSEDTLRHMTRAQLCRVIDGLRQEVGHPFIIHKGTAPVEDQMRIYIMRAAAARAKK